MTAFVTKLTATGALVYSTYLGGSSLAHGVGIAVDATGSAYVTGDTSSSDFPTTPLSFQASFGGSVDAFVTKLSPVGALVYSSYLGGAFSEFGNGIAVDNQLRACVTGQTGSADFPTTLPSQPTFQGSADAFVTKLTLTGGALVYSTFLGGTAFDAGAAVKMDSAGSAYITGSTYSIDFPISHAYQPTNRSPGTSDTFVTKLSTGGALIFSTYLGGSNNDTGAAIAVDLDNNVYVAGTSTSTDFPTVLAFQSTHRGGVWDAFVTKFSASGVLVYSSFLGGSDLDIGAGIAVDASGIAYIVGRTGSTDFPTALAFQPTNHGSADVFVAKVSAVPSPVPAGTTFTVVALASLLLGISLRLIRRGHRLNRGIHS